MRCFICVILCVYSSIFLCYSNESDEWSLIKIGATIKKEIIDGNARIVEVDLSYKKLRLDDFRTLNRLQTIENLKLIRAGVNDIDLEELRNLKNLRNLNLGGCNIKGEVPFELFPKLEVLALFENPLSLDGVKNLSKIKNLKILRIHGASVSDDGLRFIGQLNELEVLSIGSWDITENGIAHLSELKNIRELNIICASFQKQFISTIISMPKLEVLRIRYCKLSDNDFKKLETLKMLRFVEVFETEVTSDGVDYLKKQLPNAIITNSKRIK